MQEIPLSQDAALVATFAGTAMAFSHSAEDQAERWLRALRLHGDVGRELQAMGVGEAPLATRAGALVTATADTPPLGDEEVDDAMKRARRLAAARGADSISTVDLLFGLLATYGRMMDRALYVRGASLEELIDRLAHPARQPAPPAFDGS